MVRVTWRVNKESCSSGLCLWAGDRFPVKGLPGGRLTFRPRQFSDFGNWGRGLGVVLRSST